MKQTLSLSKFQTMFFSMCVVKRRTTFKRSNPGQSGQSTNRNFFQGQLKVIKTIQYRGGTRLKQICRMETEGMGREMQLIENVDTLEKKKHHLKSLGGNDFRTFLFRQVKDYVKQ